MRRAPYALHRNIYDAIRLLVSDKIRVNLQGDNEITWMGRDYIVVAILKSKAHLVLEGYGRNMNMCSQCGQNPPYIGTLCQSCYQTAQGK